MIVALIALFVACGGTAVAASVMITSGNQIRNGVITGSKLANGTVTSSKIKSGTITAKQIARGSLTGGVIGNGQIGTKQLTSDAVAALQSAGTTSYEYFRKAGPENQPAGNSQRIVTADNVPAGVYAIFAKAVISDLAANSNLLVPGSPSDARCELSAGGDIDDGATLIGTAYGAGPGDVYMQITHTFAGPGTISIDCFSSQSTWRASDSTIIAVRLGNASRVQVPG
jgi:hypothetical protein